MFKTVPGTAMSKEHITNTPNMVSVPKHNMSHHALPTTPVTIIRQTPQCSALRASFHAYETQELQSNVDDITPPPRKRRLSCLHEEASPCNNSARNIRRLKPEHPAHDSLSGRISVSGVISPCSTPDTAVRRKLFSVESDANVPVSDDLTSRVSQQMHYLEHRLSATKKSSENPIRQRWSDSIVVVSGETRTQPIASIYSRRSFRRSIRQNGPFRRILTERIAQSQDLAEKILSFTAPDEEAVSPPRTLDADLEQISSGFIVVRISSREGALLCCSLILPNARLRLFPGDKIFVVCLPGTVSLHIGAMAIVQSSHVVTCNRNPRQIAFAMVPDMVTVFGAAIVPLPSNANITRLLCKTFQYLCNDAKHMPPAFSYRSLSTSLASPSCLALPSTAEHPKRIIDMFLHIAPHENIVFLKASIISSWPQFNIAIAQDTAGQIALLVLTSVHVGLLAGDRITGKFHVYVHNLPLYNVYGLVPLENLRRSLMHMRNSTITLPVLRALEKVKYT